MKKYLVLFFSVLCISATAQNDIDAIRLSRAGQGGTSRALAMGGAFGAVGADVSASAFNPAGLALFRRAELSFSGGLRFMNNSAEIYNQRHQVPDLRFVFNNFGLAMAWNAKRDPDNRHAFAFSSTQIQNFSNKTRITGYTNQNSIARDMRNLAASKGHPDDLNYSYEGLGYDAYLLDWDPEISDSVNGGFISLLDTRRSVKQIRDLVTSGRVNDMNLAYAFTYQDRYYLGVSLGIPRVEYESSTNHFEADENDSMRIEYDANGYTHTFVDDIPSLDEEYQQLGAFHSLEYVEYFKTVGTGYNLKLGGIARVNDMLRLGFYYHTPTIYGLRDVYSNELYVYFDQQTSEPRTAFFPVESQGRFDYRVITPSRLGLNMALLFGKKAVYSLDYEYINYRRAQVSSGQIADFDDVNTLIASKYSGGHNIKTGFELNFTPIMVRGGYVMLGSPFGDVFSGPFVRHTVSAGLGLRTQSNFYLDLVWLSSFSQEDYYLFSTLDAMAKLKYSASTLGFTAGLKF